MWDRDNPYELQFLPGESCFKPEETPRSTEGKQHKTEVVRLQQAIVAAQKKLKELRETEEGHDATIKSLKGELHRKNATLTLKGFSVDFGILLDSEGIVQIKFNSHNMLFTLHKTKITCNGSRKGHKS